MGGMSTDLPPAYITLGQPYPGYYYPPEIEAIRRRSMPLDMRLGWLIDDMRRRLDDEFAAIERRVSARRRLRELMDWQLKQSYELNLRFVRMPVRT